MLNDLAPILNNPKVFYPLLIWAFFWKGWSLWRAARLRQVGWYIALLVINTAGIFEIVYLIATNKKYKANNGCMS
ncbi:MAG: hypothetical protein GXY34_12900 [Syntrophomonadaceae bacterium]|nr:hypothetical protein [Syntrophomonadaceae bacterium]